MKKKGLIVATIVMVLVLAVSLTTATYAWFTTTSQTTIDSINIKAAAGADIKIGMSTTNAYKAGASADAFVSGSVNFAADGNTPDKGAWTGESGLGFELNTNLTLDAIAKATGYGTPAEFTYTVIPESTAATHNVEGFYWKDGETYKACPKTPAPADGEYYSREVKSLTGTAEQFVPGTSTGKQIVKASGAGAVLDNASVEIATINKDYLHFVLGVASSKDNIDTITLSMFVNPGTNKTTLGVEAALYFYYNIDNTGWEEVEVYNGDPVDGGGKNYHYTTVKENMTNTASTIGAALNAYYTSIGVSDTNYQDTTVLNDGYAMINVVVGTVGDALTADEVHQIEFYIFYDGTDADCVNAALGSECEVLFSVTNTTITA